MVVMAAVCMVVVLGFAALAVDLGMVVTAEAQLQNAADAAAFAGASQLAGEDYDGSLLEAFRFAALNTCMGRSVAVSAADAQLGTYDFDQSRFVSAPLGDPSGSNAIRVTARRGQFSLAGPLNLFFAGVFGRASAEAAATAIAAADNRLTGFDGAVHRVLMPFTIHPRVIAQAQDGVFNLYPNRPGEPDEPIPGNFGALDLDNSNPGTSVLSAWIEEGFPGVVEIPPSGHLLMGGAPGLRAPLASSVELRIGDVVLVLIHESVTDGGANAVYDIVSMLPVQILGVSGNGENLRIDAQLATLSSSGFLTGPTGAPCPSISKTVLVQ